MFLRNKPAVSSESTSAIAGEGMATPVRGGAHGVRTAAFALLGSFALMGADCQNTEPGDDDDSAGTLECNDVDNDGFYSEDSDEGCDGDERDCDDTNADINPNAEETCTDGVDTNCDGDLDPDELTGPCEDGDDDDVADDDDSAGDDDDSTGPTVDIYADNDLDGYGGEFLRTEELPYTAGQGEALNDDDCDDDRNDVFPGAELICEDGVDADCNGTLDLEQDDNADGTPDCDEQVGDDDDVADDDDSGADDDDSGADDDDSGADDDDSGADDDDSGADDDDSGADDDDSGADDDDSGADDDDSAGPELPTLGDTTETDPTAVSNATDPTTIIGGMLNSIPGGVATIDNDGDGVADELALATATVDVMTGEITNVELAATPVLDLAPVDPTTLGWNSVNNMVDAYPGNGVQGLPVAMATLPGTTVDVSTDNNSELAVWTCELDVNGDGVVDISDNSVAASNNILQGNVPLGCTEITDVASGSVVTSATSLSTLNGGMLNADGKYVLVSGAAFAN